MKTPIRTTIIAGLLVLLFAYTAISKLMTLHAFKLVLAQSPLLSGWASALAWLLPSVELVAVALLLRPATQRRGLYLSLLLMAIFTIYIAYMLLTASHLPCACGGVTQYMNWRQHLVFNIAFVLLAVWGLLPQKQSALPQKLATNSTNGEE